MPFLEMNHHNLTSHRDLCFRQNLDLEGLIDRIGKFTTGEKRSFPKFFLKKLSLTQKPQG